MVRYEDSLLKTPNKKKIIINNKIIYISSIFHISSRSQVKKLVNCKKEASFKLQMDNKYGLKNEAREASLVVQVGISPKVMRERERGRMAKLERISKYFDCKKKPSTKDCPE